MAIPYSLARFAGSGLSFARTRLALIGLDLEQSVWTAAWAICLCLVSCLLILLGTVFGAGAFIVAYWSASPVWALSIVGLVYGLTGAALLALMMRRLNQSPLLMRDTLQTLHDDLQALERFR